MVSASVAFLLDRVDVRSRANALFGELADLDGLFFGGFLDSGRHGDIVEKVCVSRW